MDARAALLMAHELLRYHPVNDLYEDWLDRITELVRAVGAPLRRPTLCLALCLPRVTQLTKHLNHLYTKTAP